MPRIRGVIKDLAGNRKAMQLIEASVVIVILLACAAVGLNMLSGMVDDAKAPFEAQVGRPIEELQQVHGEPMASFSSPEKVTPIPSYADPKIADYHECRVYRASYGIVYVLIDQDGLVEEIRWVGS